MNHRAKILGCAAAGVFLSSCGNGAPPVENPHYSITAIIDPESGYIAATVDLKMPPPEGYPDSMTFLLHKQLSIDSIAGDILTGFQFDTVTPSRIPWIPDAGVLRLSVNLPTRDAGEIELRFTYDGFVTEWPTWSANVVTTDWVEIGLYLPWFPYNYDAYGPFTYDARLTVPPEYEVRGYGITEHADGQWHIYQSRPVNDIVIVASERLITKAATSDHTSIMLHHASLADSVALKVVEAATSILSTYSDWFGTTDLRELHLIASERESGGGYARPGLIVLTRIAELAAPDRRAGLLRFLGHEIGHLWWTGALTNSWEDWLNESFAEYSALLILHELIGESEFETRLERMRLQIDNTPPVWEFDRSNTSTQERRSEVEAVLYSKGPLLLRALSGRIGRDKFLRWCRELHTRSIRTTNGALGLLREREGAETGVWFEEALKQPGAAW